MEQLQRGSNKKLTLISAPAGYGKTTLLGEWIHHEEIPFAWLSLDQHDNDLTRFLVYLVASLRSILIEMDGQILKPNEISANPFISTLTAIINQISLSSQHFALVLDDYHLIHEHEIHNALVYLIENLPQTMHLVIATRTDPPLRLAQLRARAEMCEIRSEDLRFTPEEAGRFLNQIMKLDLTPADTTKLTEKTEGWIAGLQLAAISLKKHPDKQYFVSAFAGDDRYIADYLLDEALNRQPPHIQSFLLQTSILDRLNPSLCAAVTNRKDSQSILLDIEQANLFLLPLDNQRNWYRYHQLFADLLKVRLHQTGIDDVLDLHTRASIWYEQHDLLPDSIHHALAANQIERIVQLTEEMAVDKMESSELKALVAWLDGLPETTFLQHPWLLVARAWALFSTGEYEAVEVNLSEIDTILGTEDFSQELAARIRGHLAAIRTYLAELREDAATTMQQAEYALTFLPDKDIKLRSFVAIRRANCLAWYGHHDKAIAAFKEAGEAGKLAGDGQLAMTALSELAAVQMVSGKLHQAVETIMDLKNYAEMLTHKDGRRLPAMGKLYWHLSHILHELNKLDESRYYATEAVQICRQWGEKEALVYSLFALVRAYVAHGEFDLADHTINRAMNIADQISPVAAEKFRNWVVYYQLMMGKTDSTKSWSQNIELKVEEPYSYDRIFSIQNIARLLIMKGNFSEGLRIVNALLRLVEDFGVKYYYIKFNILRAKILQALNQPDEAMVSMENALSLASAQGYLRAILDEGESAARLLYSAAQKGIFPEYCQKLLDEFSKQMTVVPRPSGKSDILVEPLSERELEVLQLISQGLTNQQIAQYMVLSLHTIKSHARNIYSKLGVKNRTEAVTRARLLNLLNQD
jgi:LuxR family maltose regulon positive regulatory protein